MGRYQFTHALIQETLVGELSLTRRVRLHAQIAQTLEKLYGDEAEAHAAELAKLFAQAEAVLGSDKLVRYSLAAGEDALDASSPELASDHFKLAEVHISDLSDESKARLQRGIGLAALGTARAPADYQKAWEWIDRAFWTYIGCRRH